MSVRILQVNFQFNASPAEYERAMAPLAEAVAAVPGLRWKVWLLNGEQCEAGDVYLFADEPSLEAYVAGPIIAGLKSHPLLSLFSLKRFDVLEDISAVTSGPIHAGAGLSVTTDFGVESTCWKGVRVQ
jgi:Putative mono-oxygenase ydhR